METTKVFDPIAAAKAQAQFCEDHELPLFAPDNGWCIACGRNIYEPYTCRRGNETVTYGITVEYAGKKLITGCPFCHTSFAG